MTTPNLRKGAVLSDCGQYRYRLWRIWDERRANLPIIMLNPSTADADVDDPTIRRCMHFARREGYGGIVVGNLFALRSPNPRQLKSEFNPVGLENDDHIEHIFENAVFNGTPVLAAWGSHGELFGRCYDMADMAATEGAALVCLGTTKYGHPRHPLYVPNDQPFIPYGNAQ